MYTNIQFLRFFAAFAVIGYHFGPIYSKLVGGYLTVMYWPFIKYGFVGVDVFFVVSGFVIWVSTEKGHRYTDITQFYLRRFARIYMSYWPWFIFMAGILLILREKNVEDYSLISNFFLVRTYSPSVLPISWTLTFEVMFYIGFGLTFFFNRRIAATIMVAWGLTSLLKPFNTTSFLLNPLIFEFSLGVMLGANRHIICKAPNILLVALIVIFIYLGVCFASSKDLLLRALTFGMASFFVVAMAISLEQTGISAHRIWKPLGDASYAMYLSHYVLLTLMLTYWSKLKSYPELTFFVLTFGTLLISLLQSKYYDTPLMSLFKRQSPLRTQAAQ
ncbi:acyltransferase family protein [Ochrobactrum teleogrylli]|uniref:acyltransferase family protein n=1 Tax=Ochrobactrum teleogrylli TaxID=2479765 RepID=UPI00384F4BD6